MYSQPYHFYRSQWKTHLHAIKVLLTAFSNLSLPQHLSVLSFIVQMCSWIATEQNSFQLKGHKIILKTNEKTGEHRTVFFLFCFVFATMLQHDYTLRNVPYSKCNAWINHTIFPAVSHLINSWERLWKGSALHGRWNGLTGRRLWAWSNLSTSQLAVPNR